MLRRIGIMYTDVHGEDALSLSTVERWAALGGGATLLMLGIAKKSLPGACLAAASAPLFYRGFTGQWPMGVPSLGSEDTRVALSGSAGLHIRDAIRLERPIEEVYQYWRQLENLPRFMTHLKRVTETTPTRSHWVAIGPAGVAIEWDAELINQLQNEQLAWRSLPGSDVVSAGSVHFERVRGGSGTQVTVNFQYEPPAGRAGALLAFLFGETPSHAVREDLRRLKQLLEAGEVAQAVAVPKRMRP